MAHTYAEQARTFEASADLSASQYCFMKLDTNGRIAVATDGGVVVGVLSDKPSALGRAGRVVFGGTTPVKAGGTIAAGDHVSCNGSGQAVSVTTGEGSLGTAVEAAVSGGLVSVLLSAR